MKALPALLAAVLLAAPLLRAQEAAPAAPASTASPTLDLMPAQPEPLLPPPSSTEPTLIPEAPASRQKPRGNALEQPKKEQVKSNATEAAQNALNERIRYRTAKTRALREPAVQAEWERSQTAHTDFEKREALKRYYKLLFARMAKLDGSLKKEIALRERTSLRRLEQTRVDATTGRLDLGDDRTARIDQD